MRKTHARPQAATSPQKETRCCFFHDENHETTLWGASHFYSLISVINP
jgi:hypothetical protein